MTKPKEDSIGNRLCLWRLSMNLTQQGLAGLTGVSKSSIQSCELSKRVPGGEILLQLAAHGLDVHWLLTGTSFVGHHSEDKTPYEKGWDAYRASHPLKDALKLPDEEQSQFIRGWIDAGFQNSTHYPLIGEGYVGGYFCMSEGSAFGHEWSNANRTSLNYIMGWEYGRKTRATEEMRAQ